MKAGVDSGKKNEKPKKKAVRTERIQQASARPVKRPEFEIETKVKVKDEGEDRKVAFRGFKGRYRLTWSDADGNIQSKLVELK